jgi:hypothetical protein
MEPLREIWIAGRVKGRRKGWIQIFQVGRRRGREKVMLARRMKQESNMASIVMMCLNVALISTEGELRTQMEVKLPDSPKMATIGIKIPSER